MFCDDGRQIASAHGILAMAEGYLLCMCDCGTHRGIRTSTIRKTLAGDDRKYMTVHVARLQVLGQACCKV